MKKHLHAVSHNNVSIKVFRQIDYDQNLFENLIKLILENGGVVVVVVVVVNISE